MKFLFSLILCIISFVANAQSIISLPFTYPSCGGNHVDIIGTNFTPEGNVAGVVFAYRKCPGPGKAHPNVYHRDNYDVIWDTSGKIISSVPRIGVDPVVVLDSFTNPVTGDIIQNVIVPNRYPGFTTRYQAQIIKQ